MWYYENHEKISKVPTIQFDCMAPTSLGVLVAIVPAVFVQHAPASVCSASVSLLPTVCPGFVACNPNSIRVGDAIDIELCIENHSEMVDGRRTPVTAHLLSGTEIEVWFSCTSSRCTSQFEGVASFVSFTANVNSPDAQFIMGPTSNCPDLTSCGCSGAHGR